MTRRPNATIVAAGTLFLVASAAADVSVASIYARGVERYKSAPRIDERDVRILARPMRLAVGDRPLPQHGAPVDHDRLVGGERGLVRAPGQDA